VSRATSSTIKPSVPVRARGEQGISLIELLIAIVLTVIIVGPIGFAIYTGTRTTGNTQTRLVQSDKANLLSHYLTPDVQSSVSAQTSVSDPNCGTPRTVDLLLTEVDRDPTSGAPVTTFVSYYRQASGSATYVFRRVCSGSAVMSGPIKVSDSLAPGSANPAVNPFQCRASCATWTEVRMDLAQQPVADAAVSTTKNLYATVLEVTKRVT
jgi:Tfp pilus assembly protein PilV